MCDTLMALLERGIASKRKVPIDELVLDEFANCAGGNINFDFLS